MFKHKLRVIPRWNSFLVGLLAGSLALGILAQAALADDDDHGDFDDQSAGGFCSATAWAARTACGNEVKDDFWIAVGTCINTSDPLERLECDEDAKLAKKEGFKLCREQFAARLDVCGLVGEERHDPDFSPDDFVDPAAIGTTVEPNPFLPLVVGNTWVYEGGGEVVTVTVTDKTKLIEGVTCRVVNDVVEEDGQVREDTDDWFAQDLDGNVHYCGEEVKDFEFFEGDEPEAPELVAIDGSFKVGRDGAKSGILVLAFPATGDAYRQEFLLGEAEDVVEVISTTGSAFVPAASCDGTCLVTRDFSPLDPGSEENKFYAPGVGLVLEVDLETGERLELLEFTTP